MKMHLKRIFLQYFIGSLFIASVSSNLGTSPYKYKEFFNLEKSIVKNLDIYIKYEIGRLEILNKSTGYEDEIPFVEKRIELLTEFHKEAERNASAVTDGMLRERAEHPTSALAAITNFIHHWDPLFQNETLYGFRLLEFLNVTKEDLPGNIDLTSIKASLVYMHVFYNLSAADIYDGIILGVYGEPLNVRDALDLAEFARTTFKLRAAKQWFEVLLGQAPSIENTSDINVPLAMTDLAFLYYQFGEHEKAKNLAEEAHITSTPMITLMSQ